MNPWRMARSQMEPTWPVCACRKGPICAACGGTFLEEADERLAALRDELMRLQATVAELIRTVDDRN
jgi:hypothetical protein